MIVRDEIDAGAGAELAHEHVERGADEQLGIVVIGTDPYPEHRRRHPAAGSFTYGLPQTVPALLPGNLRTRRRTLKPQ